MGAQADNPELSHICRRILGARFSQFKGREMDASFYPYVALTHRIRKKGSRWIIRISDHCRDAPVEVLEAIALILGCKILRRRPPAETVAIYRRYSKQPEIQDRVRHRRLKRGRKLMRHTDGCHHSLEEIFNRVNRLFFDNQIELNRVGWGLRKGWKRLAHYDPLHQTITVSPVLDSPEVPSEVISYILYHEMLHSLFDESGRPGRRHHPVEFKRAETAFPGYEEAKDFLREFCRKRGRYKR
jgi:hypothetical protein